ncbi:hypothetical protein FACS189443_0440 [Planctomycetales bacterium]|nr:hypothetical protein FACS189443_0440 [Planctomycetales bacterium]
MATIDDLRKEAERGSSFAQGEIGICYFDGNGVTQDYYEAFRWLNRSERNKDWMPVLRLGGRRHRGEDFTPQSCYEVRYRLGVCYFEGKGAPKDTTLGRKLIREAADAGVKEAIDYYNEHFAER